MHTKNMTKRAKRIEKLVASIGDLTKTDRNIFWLMALPEMWHGQLKQHGDPAIGDAYDRVARRVLANYLTQ